MSYVVNLISINCMFINVTCDTKFVTSAITYLVRCTSLRFPTYLIEYRLLNASCSLAEMLTRMTKVICFPSDCTTYKKNPVK